MDTTSSPLTNEGHVNIWLKLDVNGRAIPFTEEERWARTEVVLKMLEAMAAIPDDPASPDEEFWRSMDEDRPDRPLFRELYTP